MDARIPSLGRIGGAGTPAFSFGLVFLVLLNLGGCPAPSAISDAGLPMPAPGSETNPGSGNSPPPVEQPATVSASVTAFGVDTTETPRVDENGNALPEDYAPLGSEDRAAWRKETRS